MLRRIALLALILLILPAVARALPLGSGPDAPAAVHPVQDWLSRLGHLLGGFWTPATANTGKSIDPDGKPDFLPGEGPSTDDDTGKSIDPNG